MGGYEEDDLEEEVEMKRPPEILNEAPAAGST
jgi:hypothetical protein